MTDSIPPSSIDAALLATLSRAFAQHAGADREIDIGELQRALGLKSEYLATRVLTAFDRDGNGSISKNEFLAGVRALVFGTERQKLEFAFRLHDHDGDGYLDASELERMIAISLAESDVTERVSQPPNVLVRELLRAIDTNRDGRISLDELTAMVGTRPDLLARMTHSEAIWIAPNEDLLSHLEERSSRGRGRMRQMFASEGARVGFVLVWILANVVAFGWAFRFGRVHLTVDPAMRIARALGAPIEVNGALILLPMLRRLVTWLRATWIGRIVPVDDAIGFHRLVGHAMFALAVAHGAAFLIAHAGGHPKMRLWHAVAHGHALTGAVLLGVFAVMWAFSLGFVRRSKRFELFYFTHLLYLAWVGLAIAHAPRFVVYAGVPIFGLAIEQVVRLAKRLPRSRVVSTYPLRSAVTRLEIERPKGFSFGAGDYVFLKVPSIARHEWHPFTISSAPELPSLVFHVRSLGNWTAALRRRAEERREVGTSEDLVVHIDGPYGSPSAHIFRSRYAVLIGAGIGVTPFASVLESVVLRDEHAVGAKPSAIEKVHFFWLNRDQYSFEWFRGLLSRLEERDAKGILDIHLCMTGGRAGVTNLGLELARDVMHTQGRTDLFTGLRTKTHLGHPDWTAMLGAIAKEHEGAAVDVFFCGPHGLARKLEPICQRLGMRFREEQF